MKKCVFSWQPVPQLKQFFVKALSGKFELVFVNKKNKAYLKTTLQNAEVLIGWVMDEDIISTANQLKYVLYPGAGVQQLNDTLKEMFKQKRIVFTNSHSNSFATAQHACALLLTLSNKIIQHHNYMLDGKWRTGDKDGKSFSLRQKKVGLLGFGAIGQLIYKMLNGFDCTFTAYKNMHILKPEFEESVQLFSFENDPENGLINFLKSSEIVICSLPQTLQTINLLNEHNLKHLRSTALLVNIGRGAVINEEALYKALVQQQIAGAAIDVWYNYKPEAGELGKKYPFQFPFHRLDNVVLSPHRGASPMDDPYRFTDLIYNLHEILNPKPQLKNIIDFNKGY